MLPAWEEKGVELVGHAVEPYGQGSLERRTGDGAKMGRQ